MGYASMGLVAAVILSTAHNNVAYWLRSKLDDHREGTVTHKMVASANDGKKHKEKVHDEKKHKRHIQEVNLILSQFCTTTFSFCSVSLLLDSTFSQIFLQCVLRVELF